MPVTPGNGIAAAAAAVTSHRDDRKLALCIGCAPNAKEYPRCCLPVIPLLRMALAHACIQSLT